MYLMFKLWRECLKILIFNNEYTNKPYWAEIEDESDRKKAIKIYQLHTSLERNLNPAYIKKKNKI